MKKTSGRRQNKLAGHDPFDPWMYHDLFSIIYGSSDRFQKAVRDDK